MNKGVQILLERMSSNPDEFVPEMPLGAVGRKWRDIIEAVHDRVLGRVGNEPYFNLKFLSDEEVLALHTKLQEIRGELFTKDIMARLLADDSSREASTDSVGGRSKNPYHHQLDAQKLQLEAIKLQIEKQKAEARYNNSIARVFNK